IFYQHAEGDDYDEDFADRDVSGRVLVRRTLAIAEGQVRRVGTQDNTWVRDGDDGWVDLRHQEASLTGGAGSALRASSLGTGAANARRDRHLPQIASLLDAAQFDLITRGDSGIVVIQGSAGSGKTTVGLHRIAYLRFKYRGSFRPQNILVLVFSRALAAYIGQVLPALGVDGVKVVQFESWAERLRKWHLPDLPKEYADNTPAIVTRFKTHAVMLRMVDDMATLDPGGDPIFLFEEMLTDRKYIAYSAARWAPGVFSEEQLKRVHRWCSDQHFIRAEGGGANEDDHPCLDREDDPILLRLYQQMKGPLKGQNKSPIAYDHVMVDEAQDLSPVELAVVLAC
ncbi:MAG: UvrD-helicase domain-containing protein, partial [Myxococcota bacterium]|nr:UvrD-helicase domain-containing protein [Myxococcota bacterium]